MTTNQNTNIGQTTLSSEHTNRIVSVVRVTEGETELQHQSLTFPNVMTTVAQSTRSSAVILQQGYVAHLNELFESYPTACLPIANKPLVAHQIKYFENNGLFDIYIVVYHAIFKKVEKYLREHFDADVRTSIYLVVVLEEETESANALKMISEKQKEQELIAKKPSYEK